MCDQNFDFDTAQPFAEVTLQYPGYRKSPNRPTWFHNIPKELNLCKEVHKVLKVDKLKREVSEA